MPNLIDPHKAFFPNNIPDNSELFIRAELIVYNRKRTVINKSFDGTEKFDKIGESIKINFLGFNSVTKQFTTDWTNNAENFGITNINVRINASYVPQVDITFVDVRGQSLFNKSTTSKYDGLWKFPPPIFKLIVKGYYGMTVEYYLHLLSQNGKFNSSNGNFEIVANFIGLTFAPLADIKFDYLKTIPYLNKETNNITDDITDVRNTHDLLIYIRKLQIELKKIVTSDYENFDSKRSVLKDIDDLISLIETPEVVKNQLDNIRSTNKGQFEIISNQEKIKIRLPIVLDGTKYIVDSDVYDSVFGIINQIIELMNKIQLSLSNVNLKQLDSESALNNRVSVERLTEGNYLDAGNIDLTNLLIKVKKHRNTISQEIEEQSKKLNKSINDISTKLKFKPTIKSVFKVLLDDTDKFVKKLNQVSKDAENDSNNRVSDSNLETKDFSWPFYSEQQVINNSNGSVISSIKRIPNGGTKNNWSEVKFVDEYITAKITEEVLSKNTLDVLFEKDTDGNYKWIPLNPYDSPIYITTHPYSNKITDKTIYETLVRRALLVVNETYRNINDNDFFKSYGEAEAYNIVGGIIGVGNNLRKLKEDSKNPTFNIKNINNSFINDVFNKKIINSLSGATPDTTYNFRSELIDIKSINDFENLLSFNKSSGGVPDKRIEGSSSSSNLANKIEIYIKDAYESNFFIKFFNTNKDYEVLLSQYNIALVKDKLLGEDSGKSDLFRGTLSTNNFKDVVNRGSAYSSNTIDTIVGKNIPTPETFLLYLTQALNGVVLDKIYNSPIAIDKFMEQDRFKVPGIIEIPKINLIYYGYKCYLVEATNNSGNFIRNTYGSNLVNKNIIGWIKSGVKYRENIIVNSNASDNIKDALVFFNSNDIDFWRNLDQNVRNKFKKYFEDFYNEFGSSGGVREKLLNNVKYLTTSSKYFDDAGDATANYKEIWSKFYEKHYLIIGSNFISDSINNQIINFNDNSRLNLVEDFIKGCIEKLSKIIDDKEIEIKKEKDSINAKIRNIDLRTDIYYEFKSFNDRWLTDMELFDNKPLVDSFMFVDRGMNDIGDEVMLDLSPLLNENGNSSLYTVILNLLVKNGFEFFPMQNFLNFKDGKYMWSDQNIGRLFGTHVDEIISGKPRFVCMYIGGTSTQLDFDGNQQFKNDGVNLNGNSSTIPSEFSTNNINAFLVNFGSGNQSFFKSLSLDQSEFKETNESINILDQIAKSNGEGSVPAGQSLYNVYEQRSYTCTVEMLGNMLIQPTMYFQLDDNLSFFRGAYLILEVNHSIGAPNTISTTFKGVRIPKIQKPKVTEFAIVAGYDLTIPSANVKDSNNDKKIGNINSKGQSIEIKPVVDNEILNNFVNPVDDGIITSTVERIRTNLNQTAAHGGIDISISKGMSIYAVSSGTIIRSREDSSGYGFYYIIDHGKQTDGFYYYSLYGHLSVRLKNNGNFVKKGEIIGKSGGKKGDTGAGSSTGEHLHFEIKRSDKPINDSEYFAKNDIVVLNPQVFLKDPFATTPKFADKQGKQHGNDKPIS